MKPTDFLNLTLIVTTTLCVLFIVGSCAGTTERLCLSTSFGESHCSTK